MHLNRSNIVCKCFQNIFWLNKWNRFSQVFYMKFKLCFRFSSLKIWKILYTYGKIEKLARSEHTILRVWCFILRKRLKMLAHSLSAYNFGVWHFKTRKNIEIVGSLARPMWFWGFDTLNREKYGIPEKLGNGDLWNNNTKKRSHTVI